MKPIRSQYHFACSACCRKYKVEAPILCLILSLSVSANLTKNLFPRGSNELGLKEQAGASKMTTGRGMRADSSYFPL